MTVFRDMKGLITIDFLKKKGATVNDASYSQLLIQNSLFLLSDPCVCVHASVWVYIYIYIVFHRQTVSFYQNSSVWLDTQDDRSQDRNPSNFTLDCDSDYSSTKRTTLAKGILRYFYFFRNSRSLRKNQRPVNLGL